MNKGGLIRVKKGFYDYISPVGVQENGNVVWRLMNIGYTIGYASVMWRGHKRDEPPSTLRKEIWAGSRKELMQRIDDYTKQEIEQEDSQ